jgi:hypothetical protein
MPYVYSSEDCWMACAARLATGPVAIIGNSRFGLGDNDGTDGASDRPIRWIHDALFNPAKQIHYAGQMLANAKETEAKRITMADVPNQDITKDSPYWGALKYTNYELNLFGDPALSLWTATPARLTLRPALRGTTLTVDTKGPYSWVALANDKDSIFLTQQTGIDGLCTMSDPILAQYIAAHPTGTIKMRVKAHNYLPDSATVDIGSGVITRDQGTTGFAHSISYTGRALRIGLMLDTPGIVKVELFNARGARIAVLLNRMMDRGSSLQTLPIGAISGGVYYCTLTRGDSRSVAAVIIAR